MHLEQTATHLNVLGEYLAHRSIPALTQEALQECYGIPQADVLILFGGSIPHGCDLCGRACQAGIARHLLIVGGEGHTTEALRQHIHAAYPDIPTAGRMEADIIADFLRARYGITGAMIENRSTNCGNNATNALDVLNAHDVQARSLLLIQDATMQRRMDATCKKVWADTGKADTVFIHYAPYKPRFSIWGDRLVAEPADIWGMWPAERLITLLMGEIPRLTDDAQGYGPKGTGFLAHVDMPEAVAHAFSALSEAYGESVRAAVSPA